MHRIPTPEFKVLMYGPGLPPAGVKARAHFEPGVLVVQGKGHWYTVHADRISLKTGGYDGRQWLISWYSPSGPMTAMLQGEEAVDAFIRLAPDEVSGELHRVRRTHSRREWVFRSGMALLGLLLLVPLLLLGGSGFTPTISAVGRPGTSASSRKSGWATWPSSRCAAT
jgi:hypothetical protein